MIKINRLEIENVKKIKATKIIPANSGLTVIGGKNGQGKHLSWTQLHGPWVASGIGHLNRNGPNQCFLHTYI